MPHLVRRLGGGALLIALLCATAPSEPPVADQQLRLAVDTVLPSVVEVIQDVQGQVVDTRDGSVHGPYEDTFAGTGFFVSSDGYIVTAAHVASPTAAELSDELSTSYIDDLYHCDPTTATDQCAGVESQHHDEVVPHLQARNTTSTLSVLLQSMDPAGDGLPATLSAASQSDRLDVAVVHIDVHDAPIALLAHGDPSEGVPLALIGYPAPSDPAAPDTLVPTVTTGQVTSVATPDATSDIAPAATTVETSAYAREGNSGGPGITADAKVQGIVSYGSDSNTDNFLPDAADIRSVVSSTPARNMLGRTDEAIRAGFDAEARDDLAAAAADFRTCAALFPAAVQCADRAQADASSDGVTHAAGVVVAARIVLGVLAVAMVTIVAHLLVRRRRRRTAGDTAGGAGWPPPPPLPPPF